MRAAPSRHNWQGRRLGLTAASQIQLVLLQILLVPSALANSSRLPQQRRVLYMCHKPGDGPGHGGMLPQELNKNVIVPAKTGPVEYSFLEPSFAIGFKPFMYQTNFSEWAAEHGPLMRKSVAMGGKMIEQDWTPEGTHLPELATAFPTLIPPAEHLQAVANELCFGSEHVPCYEAAVAVACPNPEEPKMMALADKILIPGGTYYLGNMARQTANMAALEKKDPCELPALGSRGSSNFTMAPRGRLPQPIDSYYCTYDKAAARTGPERKAPVSVAGGKPAPSVAMGLFLSAVMCFY